MACVNRNNRDWFCTEPIAVRRHITKLLCDETGETIRQKQTPTRLSLFTEIDNTFDNLFVNRGASTNLGKCTFIRNPKCSRCKTKKIRPRVLL